MLNCGWSLTDIAAFFGVSVEAVIEAVRKFSKDERDDLKAVK